MVLKKKCARTEHVGTSLISFWKNSKTVWRCHSYGMGIPFEWLGHQIFPNGIRRFSLSSIRKIFIVNS